jgi:hypothetical protein
MKGKPRQPGLGLLTVSLLIVLAGSAFASLPRLGLPAPPGIRHADESPPGPDRFASIFVEYTKYTWWMARWRNDAVVCKFEIDHQGYPTYEEVYAKCPENVADRWWSQDVCIKTQLKDCPGYYIFLVNTEVAEREITVELPSALAWVSLEDCQVVSTASTTLCEYLPTLVITGEEPLPNEEITGIGGLIDGEPFTCDSPCQIRLAPTDEDGASVEFWAYSSYGDSSETFSAQVRVVETDLGDPDQTYWYVDVLSDRWMGVPPASCAEAWEAFPPVGGPPAWLTTPKRPEDLLTEVPYNYLAANLIQAGVVDASACSNGGLLEESYGYGANTCGLEAAQEAVTAWQNQFDDLILEVAEETSVPAQLLKRLFARESQFWPAIYEGGDIGLGQLTEDGADTTLLWNPSFYDQFCPLALDAERCNEGYLHLDEEERSLLRLGLVHTVNAACADCPLGIDLSRADFSVRVFGHALQANCEQAGRLVRNISGDAPGEVASYEDMWKFTLINYNAGPGCLGDALLATHDQGKPFEWDNVAPNLYGVCATAIDYVEDISQ